MASFVNTIHPTNFGFFDDDTDFQSDADSMVSFVKHKCGDSILSVELTSKMIWTCFEESTCEYSKQIAENKIQSELANILGMQTGSVGDIINKYPRQTLEFLMRQAEPYASMSGNGGSYDEILGYFNVDLGRQDYNFYTEFRSTADHKPLFPNLETKSKLKVMEVFYFNPIASQQMLLNASNITNFLATEFNYESYVNSTVFYILPVFEDLLRRGMLATANRVRRSNYSYDVVGRFLKVYPVPANEMQEGKLFVKVSVDQNPFKPSFQDDSITGVSGANNAPYGNLVYKTINQPGRQWIREYTLANCKELLGLVRSKIKTIPIPGAELTLDGDDLRAQGREDKEKLIEQIKAWLDNLTYDKMLELQAARSENLMKQLRAVPMPKGRSIQIF